VNSFYEHHKDSIRFRSRCFDRILLNGLSRRFISGKSGWDAYWQLYPVSRNTLHGVAGRFNNG
jgi:transposase